MNQLSPLNSTSHLLTRLLETPDLVQQVQSLPAPSLLKLVNHIGLEDSAELLALATTEQLTRMLDEDLWKENRGEALAEGKIGLWLTALEEMGSRRAAEKLADLDEEFLTLFFSRNLHAIELEALQFLYVRVEGDSWQDDRLEKLLEDSPSHEIAGVLVLATPSAPWESLLPLLLSLEECDSALVGRILQRLATVTEQKAEREGGLYEVLSQEEALEADAHFSRNLRRMRDGYVPKEEASALLGWIRQVSEEDLLRQKGRDPVSRAYFREYEGMPLSSSAPTSAPPLALLLKQVIGEEEPSLPLLEGKARPLAGYAAGLGGEAHQRFQEELNFLAQAVLAMEKGLRASEAAERVIELCERGLEVEGAKERRLSAVPLFALGWKKEESGG